MSVMEHKIKKVLQKIRSGDISSSVKEVESFLKKNKNQAEVVINILLQTSFSITSRNLQESTTALDVFKISLTCCNYLESGFKHDKVKYLSALHHILKYLIQEGNVEDASKLMKYLFVVKPDEVMDDTVANVLYATYYCFRSRLIEELQCAPEIQSQLIILKDTVNILMCCGSKYLSVVVDHALLFLKFIESNNYNKNFNELFDHTLHILELYLTSNHTASNVNDQIVTKCVNIFVKLTLKCVEFDNYVFVGKIISVLVYNECNFRNESVEADCFKLFRLTLSTFSIDQKINQQQLKGYRNNLATVISKYGAHDLVKNVFVCITVILHTANKKWFNSTSAEWSSQWDLPNIGCFHKIIMTVIQALESFRVSKNNITEEVVSSYLNNIVNTVLLQLVILSTTRYYLSNCNEIPEKLVLEALNALNNCVSSITELKRREFSSWASYWTNIVFEVLKISQELVNHEQWLVSRKFYATLCKAFVDLEDTSQQSYSSENGKLNAFIGYINASLSLKEYEKALTLCAVALVLLPGKKKKIFECWGYAKLNGIAGGFFELEQHSLLNLFKEETNTYLSEFPSLKWDIAVIEEYFIDELEHYSKNGVGMFNCLYSVSKDGLKRLSNSILNARGTEILLEAACSQEDIKILQNCSSLGKETLSRILKYKHVSTYAEKFKLLILLGNLQYRIYLIDLVMLQMAQKERIEYIASTEPKIEPKDEKDINDKVYSVTSEYENLTIEKEAKLVHQLNTAVHYWLQLLDLEKYADTKYLKIVIENIENVAHLYGLLGCVTHEINLWGLHYKLNCIIGSDTGKLQAVSFILRLCNFESEHLLEESERIAQSLEIDKSKEQQILYCHYLLGKSWMSLKNLQMEVGVRNLIQVKNMIGKSSEYEHKLLLAECYYLLSKYLSISDWKVPPQLENELSLSCGYTALWILKYLVGKKRSSIALRTRLLYITLKLVEWLTEMHIALRWTEEIFRILKELLVTCQIAVLPIRSSQILAFMAEILLMKRDVNDSKTKMMSLEKILNLKSYKMADEALEELKNYFQKLKVSSTDRADSIFQKHVKLVNFNLDKDVKNELICSNRASKLNELFIVAPTGSPDFRKKVPKLYRAMCHKDDCGCYMCQNFTSHTVVIHYYSIIALFTELEQCAENTISTYETGLLSSLCLYEKESKQIATVNRTFTEVTGFNITFSEIQDQFKIYCTKYISLFSDYLASYKLFTQASDLNTEAICLQETVKGPKSFYLRDTFIVKYGLTIFQLCYSETLGINYEETLSILLDEKTVANFKKLGEDLKTPQLKLKYANNLSTPRKNNSFLQECSFKICRENEDQINNKMKQLIFDSSSDTEGEFLQKDIPVIIVTDTDNYKNKTGKKVNAPKGTTLNKSNPKSIRKKKNNFLVYVSPGEDIKLTRKKESSKITLDSSTVDKIKDQNNDPDYCEVTKDTMKNKLIRPNMQRKGKNASHTSNKSKVGNKQKKTVSHIFESSEEEINHSTGNSKLTSFPNCSTHKNKIPSTNLRIFYSSSDEETFSVKCTNPTKIDTNKFVKEVYTSDSQILNINQEDCEKSGTTRKRNKVCTSKRTVTLKSKVCVSENESNSSHTSNLTNGKTSKSDIKLPDDNLVKHMRSTSKIVSASGNSEAKERPSRRVTRKKV